VHSIRRPLGAAAGGLPGRATGPLRDLVGVAGRARNIFIAGRATFTQASMGRRQTIAKLIGSPT
jgi:hypothetical protein